MNSGFATAAGLSLITAGVHTFAGGVYVARPLLADRDLPRVSRCMNYFCWHLTTILLVVQAGAFAWAAGAPESRELAVLFTGLDAVYAALCAWVGLREGIAPWKLPAMSLFAVTCVAGVIGLV